LHQVGDLFELNVKLRCQKVILGTNFISLETTPASWLYRLCSCSH